MIMNKYITIVLSYIWLAVSAPAMTLHVDTVFVSDESGSDTLVTESKPSWEQRMQQRLEAMTHENLFETTQLGMMVWDLTADSCLFRYHEKQRMRPASTQKCVTAVSALDLLGGDYELTTTLYYTGEINDSLQLLNGDLYCKGGMDPLFGQKDLSAFVDAVKRLGVTTISGDIYADVCFKDTLHWGEGWCWDDDNPSLVPLLVDGKNRFRELLHTRLREAGISLRTVGGTPDKNRQELCVRKHTLVDVLVPMMKRSDNLYAESIFYQIAHSQGGKNASAKAARNYIYQLMTNAGIDSTPVRVADGSGLSLYNYITPQVETLLLRYAWKNQRIYEHLLPALPVAGVDGTLANRMKGTPAAGNVKAKTGTVTGVSALAGYCTARNGHLLCFSIMNQGVPTAKVGRDFQDRVCAVLCGQ